MNRGSLARFAASLSIAFFFLSPRTAAQPPSFMYGATFFYERVPRSQWAAALARYRELGVNTIDLYVMWNWHELDDGDFDFTGRTNPRRDLSGLFVLLHAAGFHIVLRPGPVIRNEWRNGGYPAWLLRRAEYNMPARDVLEGRYPATATLQNAHSDAAAQEWMRNRTHMHYATRWLESVFRVALPWKADILAIALDDDQGAYLDNDTWPGLHFHEYIRYLASIVHSRMGPSMPVFINTYQMKVTGSAPAWAWGNWYQSDAYSIGEHDRSQLEFSTGLLQTQSPRRSIMISEFQAGWLQSASDSRPRSADPTNTTLALHSLLQMGAHGIVNFPVQDTLNPAGWEAPWTNAFYSWDAALSVSLSQQARFTPTARFGALISRYGEQLAQTHPAADAAVAYLTSAYDSQRIDNASIVQIAQATIAVQRGCRIVRVTCALVDLRFISLRDLHAYRILIVPRVDVRAPYIADVRQKLRAFTRGGGRIVHSALYARIAHPAAGGIPNAVLLVDDKGRFGFLDIVNYGRAPLRTRAARVHYGTFAYDVGPVEVPPRDALLLPLHAAEAKGPKTPDDEVSRGAGNRGVANDLPLRPGSILAFAFHTPPPHEAIAYSADVYADGYPVVVIENSLVRLILSPCAGARAFVFEEKDTGENLFTTVGGLRDAWSQPLPASPRDYIAKYTHPIATGTFNRCYAARIAQHDGIARASFAYTAPDAPPFGATFSRTIRMDGLSATFTVETSATFRDARTQSAQQITSFAIDAQTKLLSASNAYGFFDAVRKRIVMVCWSRSELEIRTVERHEADALVTLTLRAGVSPISYAVAPAGSVAQAQAVLAAFSKARPSVKR